MTYKIGESVRLQDIETRCWDMYGVVIDGTTTTRHRKYMSKVPNSDVETEEENSAGAGQATEQ